jgi:uncharacterized protein
MEYKRFQNTIVARLDKGEEILEQIKNIALKENIKLASIQGIGATNDFTIGVFEATTRKYNTYTFQGSYEIVSLLGSINTMNHEYYSHIHMSAGDDKGNVVGGHLTRAIISFTCELRIQIIDGEVDRKYDDELGINLYSFE